MRKKEGPQELPQATHGVRWFSCARARVLNALTHVLNAAKCTWLAAVPGRRHSVLQEAHAEVRDKAAARGHDTISNRQQRHARRRQHTSWPCPGISRLSSAGRAYAGSSLTGR